MKEILYRAKDIDSGEWVYGNFVETDEEYSNEPTYAIIEKVCLHRYGGEYVDSGWHKVDVETRCEFTGLYDRLSHKIFDGDIIEDIYEHKKFIVAWDDMNACFALTIKNGGHTHYEYRDYEMDDTHEMEVIGNIYDNPELLD